MRTRPHLIEIDDIKCAIAAKRALDPCPFGSSGWNNNVSSSPFIFSASSMKKGLVFYSQPQTLEFGFTYFVFLSLSTSVAKTFNEFYFFKSFNPNFSRQKNSPNIYFFNFQLSKSQLHTLAAFRLNNVLRRNQKLQHYRPLAANHTKSLRDSLRDTLAYI